MKKHTYIAAIAALLFAAPAAAEAPADLSNINPQAGSFEDLGEVDLADLETVAVQPIAFTTTATRREAEVMFSTLATAEAPDADIAKLYDGVSFEVSAPAPAEDDGLDFAGSSTELDTNALTMGFGLGNMPLIQAKSADTFKSTVASFEALAPTMDAMFSSEVAAATRAYLTSAKAGKFDVEAYSNMLASATLGMVSTDDPSIQRRHGYLLVGLWIGYAVLSAATDSVTDSTPQIGESLILLLVKDAQFGGSDKSIAAIVRAAVDDLEAGKATATSLMAQGQKMLEVKADSAAK